MALNPKAFVDEVMNGFSLHIEPPSYIDKPQSDFAISREFYFHESSHMRSLAKIKSS